MRSKVRERNIENNMRKVIQINSMFNYMGIFWFIERTGGNNIREE